MEPDLEMLSPVMGYMELGMYADACDEWDKLPAEIRDHPVGCLLRLDLMLEMKKWEEGANWATSLCERWPEENEFHFRAAYCLHELKKTSEARERLLSGPEALRQQPVYYYNLACYEAQLGNISEAKRNLQISFQMDVRFKADSQKDPDLAPLRESPTSEALNPIKPG